MKRKKHKIGYYVLIFLFAGALTAVARTTNGMSTNSISGYVYDDSNGEILIGANVYLEGTYIGSSTNLSGYYVIPKIAVGEYTLLCDYMGYKPFRKNVKITPTGQINLNIRLKPDVISMAAIVVTADSIPTGEKLFKRSISKVNLSARQISQVPQIAEADLLRALQTLPGIKPLSDFSSQLYIRGGTPDQNLYLLDGTDVYNPEHAFGFFSTFNTEAVKQVDISKGGFNAEYGGRLSSVINVTHNDGNRERFEGNASVSLLSAKTTLQMPIGSRGSISGSFRRTYFDKTFAKALDDFPTYYFYDGNFKAFFEIDKKNKLSLSGYGGRDVLDVVFNPDAQEKIGFNYKWGNETGSLRWTHIFSPRLFSNFWITGSRFSSDLDFEAFHFSEKNELKDITYKGNLEFHHSTRLESKFGFEFKNINILYKQPSPDGLINIDYKPKHLVGYYQVAWKPTPLWDIQAGVRFNHFKDDTTYQNWAPRLSIKRRLSDKASLKFATGIYYQYLHRVSRFMFTDIWSSSNKFQNESKSVHFIAGYQQELGHNFYVEAEVYHKDYDNIYAFNQLINADVRPTRFDENGKPVYNETDGVFMRGDGRSTGFELLLRKDTGRITGWLGYSFARTQYAFDPVNNGNAYTPRHDRTSTINSVTNIQLSPKSNRWMLGLNFVYATGQPYTEPGSAYIIGYGPNAHERNVEYAPTKINNIRIPYYARLDLSLTYTKTFTSWTLQPYLQIFNLGNRKNVWFVNYEYEQGVPDAEEQYMLPRLPTIGVNIRF